MKRTSLYDRHRSLGAKMVSFAGFEMPLHYSGIIDEHLTVREKVGVFDLSHMGEFEISGAGAASFLDNVTVNEVSELTVNQAQYTTMCLENGGIVDDCVLYALGDRYLLVVNAANIEKDFQWLEAHRPENVVLVDSSSDMTLIAIQGPKSRDLLVRLTPHPEKVRSLGFYRHTAFPVGGLDVMCARTGYTGELGYELYIKGTGAVEVWDKIMKEGSGLGIKAVGLGARDTLRLEMKYCLYGNDIDETTDPLEAGLGWITKVDKGDFVGREAIIRLKKEGVTRRLIGIEMKERGIPRKGYPVLIDGEEIGTVTSGCYSPSLKMGIGMAYVKKPLSRPGTRVEVSIRDRRIGAEIVKTPFWKSGTASLPVQ